MLAVLAGKFAAQAILLSGAGLASNVPGRVALAVSPSVLASLASQSRLGVIAVSGTNGKSTTTGFVLSILQAAGYKVACNRLGANLVSGVTSSLVDAAAWNGSLDVDYCLLEIDEAALPVVAQSVRLKTLLVTNLFRDQLDRFGELDTTARLIEKGIVVGGASVVLNADDPNVARLGAASAQTFFGIESLAEVKTETSKKGGQAELAYCGNCGSEYAYSLTFYGQLGHYHCPNCKCTRVAPQVLARAVKLMGDGSQFNLALGDLDVPIKLSLPGLFNVYNAVAAAALAHSLGVSAEHIAAGLSGYSTLFGRSEHLVVGGKSVLIQLIKNPAGASQAVRAAVNDPNCRLLIAINDNYADGRDVSWLWDADFELFCDHKHTVTVSGVRAADMAVRLKYAGLDERYIVTIDSLEAALHHALQETAEGQTLWLLPTYTCLLELQQIARSMGHVLAGT